VYRERERQEGWAARGCGVERVWEVGIFIASKHGKLGHGRSYSSI